MPPTRVRREVKVAKGGEAPKAGEQVLVASVFAAGERVDVIGTSRGLGLPGRRQAPPLRRRRGDARLDVPPRARLDRRLVVPVARRQGHARRRAHGQPARDDAEPAVVQVDAENNLLIVRGAVPGAAERLRADPQGDCGEARAEAAGRSRDQEQGEAEEVRAGKS